MPVALFKRRKMDPECMLDQPIPLAYYSTFKKGTVPEFHPRTIRQLINLKTKEFVQNKQNKNIDVSTTEFTQFQVEFREVLFAMFDKNAQIHMTDLDKEFEEFNMEEDIKNMLVREKNIIMGVDVPADIDAEVEAMTDEELEAAFEEITAEPPPPTSVLDRPRKFRFDVHAPRASQSLAEVVARQAFEEKEEEFFEKQ
jgi:hypothetical protein